MASTSPTELLRASQVAGEASAAAAEVAPPRLVEPDLTGAAFFDVDNTVMRGASIFHLARGLAKRNFFTAREVGDFAIKQAKFVVNGSEDLEDMASATEAGLAFVKGKRVDEVVSLGEEIFDELMTRKLWPGTLALAQGHLDRGPGLGRRRASDGQRLSTRNGAAKPRPRATKTRIASSAEWVRPNETASVMKGAKHGAATTTARAPVRKAPSAPP